jgi:hypothetical protein
LTNYIVRDIVMTKIEFYKKIDGTKPARIFLDDLQTRAQHDPNIKQMYLLVLNGLQFLRRHGVEHALENHAVLSKEDGGLYTIVLVKELVGFKPLLEFRINWNGVGAARLLFLVYEHEGDDILVLMDGVMKQTTTDSDFGRIRNRCIGWVTDFQTDPKKYITL